MYGYRCISSRPSFRFFFFKQKTAFEVTVLLEFRRVLFRSHVIRVEAERLVLHRQPLHDVVALVGRRQTVIFVGLFPVEGGDAMVTLGVVGLERGGLLQDRKSTRLNSSHTVISYAVFCLKKK